MRVTRGEARIYPTVTFEAQASEYVSMLRSDPTLQHFAFTEVKTDFEFLVNSNSFLRVRRNSIVMRLQITIRGTIPLARPRVA
jgi:hypothetical protein